ncbi:hypothetical protein CF68_20065 [Cupriavidus sp. SK-4]|uniref:hypothetical protein n=1 Tax=Cupriavidus sp. SK-4 TaxID=574750 RepID=UPI000451C807|nr:hypothetical protein [Cupriavidus sp. SK-4]EYS96635.1 hypothetical protein CF68_20065 [Cupriavidus sp. SK-4]
MGAIALFGALACFWFVGAKRAAFVLAGVMVLGPVVFLMNRQGGQLDGNHAWFSDLIPSTLVARFHCPDDGEPVKTRIFTEEHVDTEVHRLISTGVCQNDAITRIHIGWGAKFAPEYLARYGRRVP